MDIIIAEDNRVSRLILARILESQGHRVFQAKDGLGAWKLICEKKARLVITDWMMPNMDGIKLCRKVREEYDGSYVYLIVLTARSCERDTVEALEAGADHFLVKPVNALELKARVLSGERIIKLEDMHRRAGLKLIQSEKLAAVGQLAAGVAHEINNPAAYVSSNLTALGEYRRDLVNIQGLYDRLVSAVRGVGSALPVGVGALLQEISRMEREKEISYVYEDTRVLIDECVEGTERIKKIVSDLKNFAHPGDSKLKLYDIKRCLETTLNVVWNELKYKTDIVRDYEMVPLVRCFPQQLNQVFMNLLLNAAQSISMRGKIHISVKHFGESVVVSIRDTGVGIPEESQSRIFEPFYTTKDVGEGTGLGLHISRNIVRDHGGTIEVASTPGEGTTFTVSLPAGKGMPVEHEISNSRGQASI